MGMTIEDDLEKECQYCYREIDNSGLEGFRCTNRTVIKVRGFSWCYPKNANKPCSICEYCEPKQDMEMTIDKAISHLYTYSSTMGSGQTTQAQHEESKRVAIDIMRKYQKIEEIYYHQSGRALKDSLRAVLENEFDWRTADDNT